MTIFTNDALTLASDTKIPAQLAAGDKGHTTPTGLAAFAQASGVAAAHSAAAATVGQRKTRNTQAYGYEWEVMSAATLNANPLIDMASGTLRLMSEGPRASRALTFPGGWAGHTPSVFLRGDGKVSTEWDNKRAFRNAHMVKPGDAGTGDSGTASKTYVVTKSGNDSNGGLSESDSLLTIAAALAKVDVLTVLIKTDTERDTFVFDPTGIGKSVNIIGYGKANAGRAWFFKPGVAPNPIAFTVNGTYANVYECDSTFDWERPVNPRILDANGLPTAYNEVTSVAEVAAGEPGLTYYFNNTDDILYVNATTTPVVGTDILASHLNWGNHIIATADDNTNVTIYMENIVFTQRASLLSTGGTGNFYALNCAAISGYHSSLSPWSTNGLANAIFHSCIAAYSKYDGFNVTGGNHTEIDCKVYACGDGGGSSQASSVHTTTNALRIRGEYEVSYQNAILDVGSGVTVNVGVMCSGITPTVDGGCIATAGTRAMHNILCHPAGAGNHYQAADTAVMTIDGNIRGIRTAVTGSGTVVLADAV